MSDKFIAFAIESGIDRSKAERLASTCVTNSQLSSLLERRAARLSVDAMSNGRQDSTFNATQAMQSLGIDVADKRNHRNEWWESPAKIQGETMTWGQLYDTTLRNVATAENGTLNMRNVINDQQLRDERITQRVYNSREFNFLEYQSTRASKNELPNCQPLISSNETPEALGNLAPTRVASAPCTTERSRS